MALDSSPGNPRANIYSRIVVNVHRLYRLMEHHIGHCTTIILKRRIINTWRLLTWGGLTGLPTCIPNLLGLDIFSPKVPSIQEPLRCVPDDNQFCDAIRDIFAATKAQIVQLPC